MFARHGRRFYRRYPLPIRPFRPSIVFLAVSSASYYIYDRVSEKLTLAKEYLNVPLSIWSTIQQNMLLLFTLNKDSFEKSSPNGIFCDHSEVMEAGLMDDFIKQLLEMRHDLIKCNIDSDKIPIPTIVVVGAQSSGKSSVLENLIGIKFLPRGDNMVTKRPIELTLVNDPNTKFIFAILDDSSTGTPYTDFDALGKRLTELNSQVQGWISDEPIRLEIHAPNIPDLCLVDLPGYIQVSSKYQPSSLKQQIAAVCDKYLKDPNIILAISAADVDLANSESLRACAEIDPSGLRTVGVVTKIDMVDPTTLDKILNNTEYPLKNGYVGVSNVSDRHTRLNQNTGFSFLKGKLRSVLRSAMQDMLPELHSQVLSELDNTRYAIKSRYTDRVVSSVSYLSNSLSLMRSSIEQFSDSFIADRLIGVITTSLFMNFVESAEFSQLTGDCSYRLEDFLRSGLGKKVIPLISAQFKCGLDAITLPPSVAMHGNSFRRLIDSINEKLVSSTKKCTIDYEDILKPLKRDVESASKIRDHALVKEYVLQFYQKYYSCLCNSFKELLQRVDHGRLQKLVKKLDVGFENGSSVLVDDGILRDAYQAVRINARLWSLRARILSIKSDLPKPELFAASLIAQIRARTYPLIEFELLQESLAEVLDAATTLSYGKAGLQGNQTVSDLTNFLSENRNVYAQLVLQDREQILTSILQRLKRLSEQI